MPRGSDRQLRSLSYTESRRPSNFNDKIIQCPSNVAAMISGHSNVHRAVEPLADLLQCHSFLVDTNFSLTSEVFGPYHNSMRLPVSRAVSH